MRKPYFSVVAAGALIATVPCASAYEAMLGGNFALHARPYSRHHIMTLAAGDIVNIDHCNHDWCAVTHGPHAGYLYMPRTLDGHVYGPRGGTAGVQDGGPAEVGADLVGAPFDAVGNALDAGVSIMR
jgi:hypothetical protein